MSNELDDVARSIYNGQIPQIWRRLAPATLKTLGNWMIHFQQRYQQYHNWVSVVFCLITVYNMSAMTVLQLIDSREVFVYCLFIVYDFLQYYN